MDSVLRGLLLSQTNDGIKTAAVEMIALNISNYDRKPQEISILIHVCWKYLCNEPYQSTLFSAICDLSDKLLHALKCTPNMLLFDETVSLESVRRLCFRLPEKSSNSIVAACWPEVSDAWVQLGISHLKRDEICGALSKIFSVQLPLWTGQVRTLLTVLEDFIGDPPTKLNFSEIDLLNATDFLPKFGIIVQDIKADTFVPLCNSLSRTILFVASQTSTIYSPDSYATSTVFTHIKPFILENSSILHSPLAAFMVQLDHTCVEGSVLHEKILTSCIEHIVAGIVDTVNLRSILLRFVAWSQWSIGEGSTDLWIIGILSNFGSESSAVTGLTHKTFFDEILVPVLKNTIEILTCTNFSSGSLMNLLAFCILVGGILGYTKELSQHSSALISFMRQILHNETGTQYVNTSMAFSQIASLFKIASEDSSKLMKMFDLISRRNPCLEPVNLKKCLREYSWESLAEAGASAGFRLRRMWINWSKSTQKSSGDEKLQLTMGTTLNPGLLTNLPGLLNLGNTCYANAALQLLFHCPDFREALLAPPRVFPVTDATTIPAADQTGSTKEVEEMASDESTSGMVLHNTLLDLFSTLAQGGIARDPSTVLAHSRPTHFVRGEQQDSAEYLAHLLDSLHEEELATTTAAAAASATKISLVRRLFGGEFSRTTVCPVCQRVSSEELEDFICLFLPLDDDASVVDAAAPASETPDVGSLLQKHFSRTERITDAGKCESCSGGGDYDGGSSHEDQGVRERRLSIRQLVSNVLICLNVFTYNKSARRCQKIIRPRVRVSSQLSVQVGSTSTSFIGESCDAVRSESCERVLYHLRGMIVHHGLSLDFGHYSCVSRVGPRWVSFDDGVSLYTTLDAVRCQQFATPYLLLYSRA